MSVLVRFAPTSATTLEQYDEAMRRLEQLGGFPAEGMEYHVAFVSNGNVRVSEIWDSVEQLSAISERLMAVLADVGIDVGQPEILEVHRIIRR
jgi:hypothetical protein